MSGPTLRGIVDPNGRLNFDRRAENGETAVTIQPRKDGATVTVNGPVGDQKVDVGQIDKTERVGPLRIWMKGDEDARSLFVRDANGQTLELPLQALREFLTIPEAHQTANLHYKLGDLAGQIAELRENLRLVAVGSVHQLVGHNWFKVVETNEGAEDIGSKYGVSRCTDNGNLEVLGVDGDRLRARYQRHGGREGGTALRNGDVVELSVAEFKKLTAPPKAISESKEDTTPTLAVMAPSDSIPVETVQTPKPGIDHRERTENIKTLAALLQRQGLSDEEITKAYDAMVGNVTGTLVGGTPPQAIRTTLASFPSKVAFGLSMAGYHADHLAYNCDVVCTMEGDRLRLQSRLGMDEQYTIRREGADISVKTAAGESSLDVILKDAFGYKLPMTAAQLLGSLEAGGEAYRSRNNQVSVFRNGQAGAVLYDDGTVGALFTNHNSNQIPDDHQLLFGYHSHPKPNSKALPMARKDVEPAEPSSSDLCAFSRAAEDNDRAIPQLIWYRSGQNEITGRIFIPQKGKHGYETPKDPTTEIHVTV